jgi:4-alpha-glucanotransferase
VARPRPGEGLNALPELVREGLRALGIRRLLLSVHDLSFPGDSRDDVGRGAPLSRGGRAFLRFAAELGFHGLQLGPQGETAPHDPSPYDATLFSRNTLSIAATPLVEQGLLVEEELGRVVALRPADALSRAAHADAHESARRLLRAAWLRAHGDRAVEERVRRFAERNRAWLEHAELYAVLEALHGEPDWRRWPEPDRSLRSRESAAAHGQELRAQGANEIALYRFGQLLAHEQHEAFRAEAHQLGLLLFGDLQIGISHRDLWSHRALLLDGLRLGAPPSRTTPEGQPWGYGVLDPRLYGTRSAPGPTVAFVAGRVGKVLDEFDGLRVDHPHGWIDPWVYVADAADPLVAVKGGARLFSSPERPDLAQWAIARLEQIDASELPHGDGRVRALSPAQVEQYATLFDALVDAAAARGRGTDEIIAEVLSTQPYPVRRVLERHGLGRFRVTQKSVLSDPGDVYRAENARPQDWIMVGTHDTEPIWRVAERWMASGMSEPRAAYLASRLVPDAGARPRWIAQVAASPLALARAQLADLFVGPARNVMVFFTDLLGLREVYNRPGTVSPENWSLRVPPDFAAAYRGAAAKGAALDLPAALATAMRARGAAFAAGHRELLEQLDAAGSRAVEQA